MAWSRVVVWFTTVMRTTIAVRTTLTGRTTIAWRTAVNERTPPAGGTTPAGRTAVEENSVATRNSVHSRNVLLLQFGESNCCALGRGGEAERVSVVTRAQSGLRGAPKRRTARRRELQRPVAGGSGTIFMQIAQAGRRFPVAARGLLAVLCTLGGQ